MAATSKIITELQNKISKTTNDISISRNNFETKLNSKISARVAPAFFKCLYKIVSATQKTVLDKKINQKPLIAFRATAAMNGQSGDYGYGNSGLNPGKLFS